MVAITHRMMPETSPPAGAVGPDSRTEYGRVGEFPLV
jgi:hypothetical protein